MEPWRILAEKRLKGIGKVILVGSGKGGVGKSLIAAATAAALGEKGYRVGVFDLDIHGPSIPRLFGIEGDRVKLRGSKEGLLPVEAGPVRVMSVEFLVGSNPVPLRGNAKTEVIEDLISNTHWGELDYLVVDLPPGTGDEVLLPLRVYKGHRHGFLVVATPSILSIHVVRRLITLLLDERVAIEGVVENMSTLPTGERHPGSDMLKALAREYGVPVIAEIPYDPSLETVLLRGGSLREAEAFWSSVARLAEALSGSGAAH